MKEIVSLATFTVGVLCFVMFLVVVKPDAPIAIQASNTPADSHTSGTRGGLHLFAAVSEAVLRPR